jgi:hypothetical protein
MKTKKYLLIQKNIKYNNDIPIICSISKENNFYICFISNINTKGFYINKNLIPFCTIIKKEIKTGFQKRTLYSFKEKEDEENFFKIFNFNSKTKKLELKNLN